MKKSGIIWGSCVLVVLFILPSAQSVFVQDQTQLPSDEGDHFPCGMEWWWLYTTLILDDGRQWDMCIQFLYQMNWSSGQWSSTDGISYLRIQSWDRQTAQYYDCMHIDKHPGPFHHEKNQVCLSYDNSTYQGVYPNYTAYCVDDVNGFTLALNFTAISRPHFFAQEAVNGTVPWGTGTFQYWIMPLGKVSGVLSLKGEQHSVTGIGYTEHMFANTHMLDSFFRGLGVKNLLQVGSLYTNLAKWALLQYVQNRVIPLDSYHTSTDNGFGYDWLWAGFDNGWSLVLCRLNMLDTDDGYSAGLLILSNGSRYWEFANVVTKVTKDTYLGERDIFLPLDFEITAVKDDMTVKINFTSTTDITTMYIKRGFVEMGNFLVAGQAKGTVCSNGQTTFLQGKGTNTPLRYIPRYIRHVSNNLDLILPPNGLGFVFTGRNHYLHVEVQLKIQIRPRVDIQFVVTPSPDAPVVVQNMLARLHLLRSSLQR